MNLINQLTKLARITFYFFTAKLVMTIPNSKEHPPQSQLLSLSLSLSLSDYIFKVNRVPPASRPIRAALCKTYNINYSSKLKRNDKISREE